MAEENNDYRRGDYREDRRLLFHEMRRISELMQALDDKLNKIRNDDITQIKVDLAMLAGKAAMFGTVGGIAAGAVISVVLKKLFGV